MQGCVAATDQLSLYFMPLLCSGAGLTAYLQGEQASSLSCSCCYVGACGKWQESKEHQQAGYCYYYYCCCFGVWVRRGDEQTAPTDLLFLLLLLLFVSFLGVGEAGRRADSTNRPSVIIVFVVFCFVFGCGFGRE